MAIHAQPKRSLGLVFLVSALLLTGVAACSAPRPVNPPIALDRTELRKIDLRHAGQAFNLYVSLPRHYLQQARRFPVSPSACDMSSTSRPVPRPRGLSDPRGAFGGLLASGGGNSLLPPSIISAL